MHTYNFIIQKRIFFSSEMGKNAYPPEKKMESCRFVQPVAKKIDNTYKNENYFQKLLKYFFRYV